MSANNTVGKTSQPSSRPASQDAGAASPIQHVFVLMLENRSFDNLLAFSGIDGIIAATTDNVNVYGTAHYAVSGAAPDRMPTDPGHLFRDVLEQLGGSDARYVAGGAYPPIDNSGFAANYATTTTEGGTPPSDKIHGIMQVFDTKRQLPVMHQLARTFVVCDQWFASMPGPTWPNRLFLHGASSNGLDDPPSAAEMFEWETFDGFRFPNGSIFDALNAKRIPWRLYHDTDGPIEGAISLVSALHGVELSSVHALSGFATDLQSGAYPYQYTFIEPNYGDVLNDTYEGGSSQHPMDGMANGEALIKTVYEAIRNSPLWESSVLIVAYDEHGGFYDHFAPGPAMPPNDGGMKYSKHGFTFSQYGVRVPAIVVSPWVAHAVDHTVYDHTSVLATLSHLFGVPHLTDRDAAANPIQSVVKPLATARTDCPTKLDMPVTVSQPASLSIDSSSVRAGTPVPAQSTAMGFLGVLLKADSKLSTDATGDRIAASTAAKARFSQIVTRADAKRYAHDVMAKVQAMKAAKAAKAKR